MADNSSIFVGSGGFTWKVAPSSSYEEMYVHCMMYRWHGRNQMIRARNAFSFFMKQIDPTRDVVVEARS